jgi:hypothetical protein
LDIGQTRQMLLMCLLADWRNYRFAGRPARTACKQ